MRSDPAPAVPFKDIIVETDWGPIPAIEYDPVIDEFDLMIDRAHGDAPPTPLDELDDDQRRAVTLPDDAKTILVCAGPGSGKTRMLTHRAAWLARERGFIDRVRMLTFSKKAANEMVERVKQIPGGETVSGSTLHSWLFQEFIRDDRWRSHPELCDWVPAGGAKACGRDLQRALLNRILDEGDPAEVKGSYRKDIDPDEDDHGVNPDDPTSKMIDLMGRVRARGRHRWETSLADAEIDAAWEAYDAELQRRGAVDFDLMLVLGARLLAAEPEAARELVAKYDRILVDEMQDVSPVQWTALDALRSAGATLFAVGDERQAIYGFRGGDSAIMRGLAGEDGVKLAELQRNYRSSPQIVHAANLLARTMRNLAMPGDLTAKGKRGPNPNFVQTAGDNDQAKAVVDWIKGLHRHGTHSGQIAVLTRTNKAKRPIRLAAEHEGIMAITPADRLSGRKAFGQVVAIARIKHDKADDGDWDALVKWGQGIIGFSTAKGPGGLAGIQGVAGQTLKKTGQPTKRAWAAQAFLEPVTGGLYEEWAKRLSPDDNPKPRHERRMAETVAEALELACTTMEFDKAVKMVERMADSGELGVPGFNLMTVHKAKGLEFDHVWLPSMDTAEWWGWNDDPDSELCTMFVGVTRAARELRMSARAEHITSFGYPKPTGALEAINWMGVETDE